MKKMLLISGIILFPQDNGGATRLKNTIYYLSKKYEIDLIFFKNKKYFLSTKEINFLSRHTKSYKIINLGEKSIKNSILSFIPYHFTNYFSTDLIKYVKMFQRKKSFELIRIETTQLLYLFNFIDKKLITEYVAYDVSFISFFRRLSDYKNIFKWILGVINLIQIYFFELVYIRFFNNIYVVSNKDKYYLCKLFRICSSIVSENGIEKIDFLPMALNNKIKLGFVGSSFHSPNISAVNFIIDNIMPKLDENLFELHILGNYKKEKKLKKNVFIHSYVNVIDEFYKKINIFIAPIFSGSGTKLKILESLSFGIPVISTEVGVEGIDLKSNFLVVVSKKLERNSNYWVEKIYYILNNYENLSINRKELKESLKKYKWENIFKKTN